MKILHILSNDEGGISTYVKNLIKENDGTFTFHVLSFSDYNEEFIKFEEEGKVILSLMPRPKITGIKYFVSFLFKYFEKNKFDFIECHIPGYHSIPFKIMSSINGSNFFSIHSHSTQLIYGREMKLKEKIIDKINPYVNRMVSDLYISCGKFAAQYAFGNSKLSKNRIIYNSVDTEKFLGKYSSLQKNKNENKIIIGHVGYHGDAKNLPFILSLAKHLKENSQQYNYEIQMIGSGELSERLINEIQLNELNDIVKVFGRQENVEDFYGKFDVTILPSLSEGFPTVVIESQATGTPCICSNKITDEVDLSLNLVEFLPISINENTFKLWQKKIEYYAFLQIPSKEKIEKKFKIFGIDSKNMFEHYVSIYRNY